MPERTAAAPEPVSHVFATAASARARMRSVQGLRVVCGSSVGL